MSGGARSGERGRGWGGGEGMAGRGKTQSGSQWDNGFSEPASSSDSATNVRRWYKSLTSTAQSRSTFAPSY